MQLCTGGVRLLVSSHLFLKRRRKETCYLTVPLHNYVYIYLHDNGSLFIFSEQKHIKESFCALHKTSCASQPLLHNNGLVLSTASQGSQSALNPPHSHW